MFLRCLAGPGSAETLGLINEILSNLNANDSVSPGDKDELCGELQSLRESLLQTEGSENSVAASSKSSGNCSGAVTTPSNSPGVPQQSSADPAGQSVAVASPRMSEETEEDYHGQALHLLDLVRKSTNISHEDSRALLQSLLSSLVNSSQDLNLRLPRLLTEIQTQTMFGSEAEIQSSEDYSELVSLLDLLTKVKEDDQQRNWMLHEDETIITTQLTRLCRTLQNAGQEISVHVLARYKYFYVQSLVEYFQMETRWSIRKLLIETFTVMCSLDTKNIISLMLESVLPLELVQDMLDNSQQGERLKHCSVILTVLFSLGEAVPVHYKEKQLGGTLVTFLLEKVENSGELDTEEDMADVFMGLLASYNLQFQNTEDNIVLHCLSTSTNAKVFTEKLLLLLNRNYDPAEILGPRESGVNSVHKLVLDVFSSEPCIGHFYTNDLMVLIDIIARQLADLGPGMER